MSPIKTRTTSFWCAHAREDIEALRRQIPDLAPFEDPTADYRWRAVVTRADWAAVVDSLVGGNRLPQLQAGHSQGYGRV